MQVTMTSTDLIVGATILWQIFAAILIRFTPIKRAIFAFSDNGVGCESPQFIALMIWLFSSVLIVLVIFIAVIAGITITIQFIWHRIINVLEILGNILVGKENKTSNSHAN